MNVYVLGVKNYSDIQGPCPEGFHIPTKTELESGLKSIIATLGLSSATETQTYLHIPSVDIRASDSTKRTGYNRYALSDCVDSNYHYYFYWVVSGTNAGKIWIGSNNLKSASCSIRPFKDEAIVPDSSWTKLYYGTGDAGIYYKSDLGLISLSADGTTWLTISDKNLGATTVYNYGDTLNDANCGKLYQRGNNYGFPYTGTVTTSSTQVNANTYGPGNYYSSSTFITTNPRDSSNNHNLRGGVTGIVSPVGLNNAYIGEGPYEGNELCFTANTAGSTISLNKIGTPTAVSLETSTDGRNWSTYTFGTTITLTNIGDKVYMRNTSTTNTGFSTSTSNYYNFVMTGSISGSGDINYLLNKNSTTTVSDYCYYFLFNDCKALTEAPSLPATTLAEHCYQYMFNNCSNLESLPSLPATTLTDYCYRGMFSGCSKIKLSTTKTGNYQTVYRIPTTGTGTIGNISLTNMFYGTGGSWTGTPSINTTYYTSNTVV